MKKKVYAAIEFDPNREIYVLIKGHSRSGVAVSQIAIKLAQEFKDNKNVEIDVLQRDPVPGPLHFSVDLEVDYEKGFGENNDTKALQRLNSTVVYSLNTEYPMGFTPQSVLNAKKIILVKWQHEVGLNKSKGFIFDNKRFHGSGLRKLREGVYMQTNAASDDNAELEKFDASNCDKVEEKIRSNGSWMQSARTEIILKAVKKKLGQEAIREPVETDKDVKRNDSKIFSGWSDMKALDSKFWENLKYINTDYDNSLEAIMINANLNKLRSMILGFYKNHSQELDSIFTSIVNSKELNSIRESKELKPLAQLLKNTYESEELKPLADELKHLAKELEKPMKTLLNLLKKYVDKQWSVSFTTIYNFKKSFFNNLYGKIKAEFDSIIELNKEGTEKG